MRIGVDIGGTNTDAVLMDGAEVLAWCKAPSSPNVKDGVSEALKNLILSSAVDVDAIKALMVGTTQFANAIVERKKLSPVFAIRISLPSGAAIPPFSDWPEDLKEKCCSGFEMVAGGFQFDGRPMPFIEGSNLQDLLGRLKSAKAEHIAISGVFSPVNNSQEQALAEAIQAVLPDACITISSEVGSLSLLERENASILNAALRPQALSFVSGVQEAVVAVGLSCDVFFSQNDGTLMSAEQLCEKPVHTLGAGLTNSLRGAAFLCGVQDAVVVDIGGTTSDIGVLSNGFPRQSALGVTIGDVATNFRMPDVYTIGLGGGSVVVDDDDGVKIGPSSVGANIVREAVCFGGSVLTASDLAVANGQACLGTSETVHDLPPDLVSRGMVAIDEALEHAIEAMAACVSARQVILVGGGSILVSETLKSRFQLHTPPYAAVANAVGAAIPNVGADYDQMHQYEEDDREEVLRKAEAHLRETLLKAGGKASDFQIVAREEARLGYLPGDVRRVRIRAASALDLL